uniref:Dipeptidase n=1 Tax=Megaselia scalaris TaxID=36166 RepID=T1GRG0_MEGSC
MNTEFPHHQATKMHSQHQPHCKQTCFVFTEIADIELPPEITKLQSEKLNLAVKSNEMMNGGLQTPSSMYKSKECMALGSGQQCNQEPKSSKGRRLIVILCAVLVCVTMAGGIPLILQLRSSSLLEARMAFIRRLLTEAPLIEGSSWTTKEKEANFSTNIIEVRKNLVGAVLWPITVPCGSQYLDAVQLALEGIDKAKRLTSKTGYMRIVESSDEMEQTHLKGEVAILMGLGGGHTLGSSLGVLRSMYMLGVRFVSLTSFGCTTPWAGHPLKTI